MITIDITEDLDSLLADTVTWDRLSGGVPFRQAAWLSPWWEILGTDCQASVLTAKDCLGQIVGILPLYRRLGSRTLSMIGDGDACSDHVSVLTNPDMAVEVATAMGKHLASVASHRQYGWDLIDIDGVVEGDVAMSALASGLKECGSSLHASSRMSVWYKPVDECWDDHLKHHGKTQRRKMRRMNEKLEGGNGLEKIQSTTEDEVAMMLDAVIEMHQRRWTADGEDGSFSDPLFCRFIHETCRRLLLQGQLNLTVLRMRGQVIGGEIRMVGKNRVLYSYSSGYDVDFAELEPGRLLCIDGLLELYRSNLAGYDFMRGDEAYKARFATESKKLFRIRAVAPTLLPRLRHAVWSTSFEVKQWMRRRTGRPEILVQDPTSF